MSHVGRSGTNSWVSSLVHSITENSEASSAPSAEALSSCRGSGHLAEMRLKALSLLAPLCMGKPEMDGLILALKHASTLKRGEASISPRDAEAIAGIGETVTIRSAGRGVDRLDPIGGALLCSFLVDALGSLPPASSRPPYTRPWIADLSTACEEAISALLRYHASIITGMQSSSRSHEANSISSEAVSTVAMTSPSPDAVWSPSWNRALALLVNSISALASSGLDPGGVHRIATPLASLISIAADACNSSLIAPLLGLSDYGISDASQPPKNIPLLGKVLIMGSLGVVCTLVMAESRVTTTGRDQFIRDSSMASSGQINGSSDDGFRNHKAHPIRAVWAMECLLQISDWGPDIGISPNEDQSYDRHWSYSLSTTVPATELVEGFLGSRAAIRRLLAEVAGLRGPEPLPLHVCLHVLERCGVGEDGWGEVVRLVDCR